MRPIYLILGLVGFALADGNHRHSRQGRRRGGGQRRGRQEEAPLGNYGAGGLDQYEGAASNGVDTRSGADAELAALEANIPGIPGEDYPIFAEVPESGFACDGQVDGGYYADPEAQCQVFHICTADGQGGLSKYSFLCPNGTIFNQNYFICDWWFNFDCAEAENLYSINDDIASERAALAEANSAQAGYGGPVADESAVIEERLPSYEEEVPQDSYSVSGGEDRAARSRNGRRQGRRRGGRRGRRLQG